MSSAFQWDLLGHDAVQEPLIEPSRGKEVAHYPFRATLYRSQEQPDGSYLRQADQDVSDMPALLVPAWGGLTGPLRVEAPTLDRIALLGWFPLIQTGQYLELRLGVEEDAPVKAFTIADALPGDNALTCTLLSVTPSQ